MMRNKESKNQIDQNKSSIHRQIEERSSFKWPQTFQLYIILKHYEQCVIDNDLQQLMTINNNTIVHYIFLFLSQIWNLQFLDPIPCYDCPIYVYIFLISWLQEVSVKRRDKNFHAGENCS